MTGAVLALCSLGLLGAGGAALRADTAARHGGYADLGSATYATSGHAITSNAIELHVAGSGWDAARSLFGTVRIQATSTAGAPSSSGSPRPGRRPATWPASTAPPAPAASTPGTPAPTLRSRRRGRPSGDARAAGVGTQALMWPVRSGNWTVVAMNANGSAPVSVHVSVARHAARADLDRRGMLAGGVIVLAGGVLLLVIPVRRAPRQPAAPGR
jgi:hypothetical protein